MDVTLGPWSAEKTVKSEERTALVEAMADEAWRVTTRMPDFTPVKADGKPADTGFSISGKLTSVTKEGASTNVVAKYNVWVDGTFANVATVDGRASATGRSAAEDALRAVTESRVQMLLEAIKAGRVAKLR